MSKLTDLPNIAKAGAADLELLGINEPGDLKELDPYDMYERLCTLTAKRHDPCVIDVSCCKINGAIHFKKLKFRL
jgi:hypothetical protein